VSLSHKFEREAAFQLSTVPVHKRLPVVSGRDLELRVIAEDMGVGVGGALLGCLSQVISNNRQQQTQHQPNE
jgi:hypothetical protein